MIMAHMPWGSAIIEIWWSTMEAWTASLYHPLYHWGGFTRRKQHRPGITLNDNTVHVPTARSSADLLRPNHTPLQPVTPHAAGSRRPHFAVCVVCCIGAFGMRAGLLSWRLPSRVRTRRKEIIAEKLNRQRASWA